MGYKYTITCFTIFSAIYLQASHSLCMAKEAPYKLEARTYTIYEPELLAHCCYYKVAGNKLSPESISNKLFNPVIGNPIFNFRKDSTWWFKLSIQQNTSGSQLYLLEFLDPHVSSVQVYQKRGKAFIPFNVTGADEKFDTRMANHKNYLFPFLLSAGEQTTIYFTFTSNYPSTLNIGLRPAIQFINYSLNEYSLLGLFYGVLLIMSIYNFFIFINTREIVYLYYVAYVLCYCLNAFQEDGLGFQYIWPSYPHINPMIDLFARFLLVISFVVYSRIFLSIRAYSRKLDNAILLTLFVYCFSYVLNIYLPTIFWFKYLYLAPFAFVFFAGILTWNRGNRSAKYFLLAFSFLILFFTIVVLRITNILPSNIYTVYALNFGFVIEVVLFSYALGQRLKIGKDEKEMSDRKLIAQLTENEKLKDILTKNLEAKVMERTQALAFALEEIKQKNEEVEKLNKLLVSDNKVLSLDIKEMVKARLMLKDLTLEEFKNIYPDEQACLKYLSEIKWNKSYSCKKCENQTFSTGKSPFSRRCTKCGYDESVSSNTLFHNSKIPITSTFYLVYLVLSNRSISSHELSDKLDLRQKTCWSFKKKILEAIEQTGSPKLTSKDWGKIFYQ